MRLPISHFSHTKFCFRAGPRPSMTCRTPYLAWRSSLLLVSTRRYEGYIMTAPATLWPQLQSTISTRAALKEPRLDTMSTSESCQSSCLERSWRPLWQVPQTDIPSRPKARVRFDQIPSLSSDPTHHQAVIIWHFCSSLYWVYRSCGYRSDDKKCCGHPSVWTFS